MRLEATAAMALTMAVTVLAQARPPRCPQLSTPDGCMKLNHNTNQQYDFIVQKNNFQIEYVDGSQMKLKCFAEGMPRLDSNLLPAFETKLVVEVVVIENCGVAQYDAVFRTLNVTLMPYFNLTLANTGVNGTLTAAHLGRLPGLRSLTLRDAGSPRGPLLANLTDLAALYVTDTRLPPGELDPPPPQLELVYLMEAGVRRVPAALVALPSLRWLTVTEQLAAVEVERPPPGTPRLLVELRVLPADEALLARWAPPSLVRAYLVKWSNLSPPAVPSCESLATLTLVSPAAHELPSGWVAGCPRLTDLQVTFARNLTSLPSGLLSGARSLTHLVFRSGSLDHLPAHLFDETPRLQRLDLSGNHLKELPSGALKPTAGSLLELNLGSNALTSEVTSALSSLHQLRKLFLDNNADVQDLCNTNKLTYTTLTKNTSPLANLYKLEVLNLKNTKVSSICSDWRTSLVLLTELDLSGTRISSLAYEDLVYTRHVRGSVVKLGGLPLREVVFTAEDYRTAAAVVTSRRPGGNVIVELGGRLVCDCYLYWFARALAGGLLPGVVAAGGGPLRCTHGGTVLADDMLCEGGAGACPALPRGCTCGARPDLALGGAGSVLLVRCEGAGLQRVPPLPAGAPPLLAVDLLLAGNTITELTADDIPPLLRTLDLRNNSVEVIDEATARALVGDVGERARRVLLAGNPLECTSCSLAGARRVLRTHSRHLVGYETAVRCGGEAEGALLADLGDEGCEGAAPAVAAAVAGLAAVAALALAVVAARRGALRPLKALLWRLGLAPAPGRRLSPAELALPYDVFVTFGGGDERAALEVTARLEGAGRRVVLQERDWLPPAWVPHCIELSVSVARRTLALVSPPWERSLQSGEVRAAYEPALRGALLLVLPPGEGGAPGDAALRRYARDYPHLVLRRGETHFWRSLERALPPPAPTPADANV